MKGLPPDAATWREGKAWTRTDEMSALLIERNEIWLSHVAQGLGFKPQHLPDLLSFSHPDRVRADAPRRRATNNPQQIRRFLSKLRG